MKKQADKIDVFFREALQGHTVAPSEAAKVVFLKEAATIEEKMNPGRKWYFFLSGVILLVSIGAGIYFSLSLEPRGKIPGTVSKSAPSDPLEIKTAKPVPVNTKTISVPASENQTITSKTIPYLNIQPWKVRPGDNKTSLAALDSGMTPKEPFIPEPIASASGNNISANPAAEKPAIQPTPVVQIQSISQPSKEETIQKEAPQETKSPLTDTVVQLTPEPVEPKLSSGSPAKNWNIALGVYYSPEWMFNTLEREKYVNNFGIEGTFHIGRYSIRTGAGLSVTKGTNELSVGYNDYLGSYQKLDSMNFSWDNTHYKYVPTVYFSNEDVWDSLMMFSDTKVVKRYTYLQVPLILGYDFWENDFFSIGLRGGPILSVLLKTEQISDNYDPGKNRIILINQIAPERIQTNWQILGGINTIFHFSRRLGLELEPGIRYYFNSVYEKNSNNKKPWSVGIRAAFIVIL